MVTLKGLLNVTFEFVFPASLLQSQVITNKLNDFAKGLGGKFVAICYNEKLMSDLVVTGDKVGDKSDKKV